MGELLMRKTLVRSSMSASGHEVDQQSPEGLREGRPGHEVWEGIQADCTDRPGTAEVTQIVVGLVLVALLGGLVRFQREHIGQRVGLRTSIRIALEAAFLVVISGQTGMHWQT
jgi:hypothetical protein